MLNYHLYADDTQVIAKSTIRSTDVACRQLENCVASVQQWCASRRLQLNADKTELICRDDNKANDNKANRLEAKAKVKAKEK